MEAGQGEASTSTWAWRFCQLRVWLSIERKLTQKGPLSTTVALTERVDRVDLSVVVGDALGEALAVELCEMPLFSEFAEDLCRIALDMRWQGEHAAGLGKRHATQLPRPFVNVLEDVPMKRLKMRKIVGARQPHLGELSEAKSRCLRLSCR